MIALQDERVALDDTSTAELSLERLEPGRAIRRRDRQVFDDRDVLAAAAGAFEPDDGTRNGSRRRQADRVSLTEAPRPAFPAAILSAN